MQRSELPVSLASVRPFLEEARAILAQQSPQKASKKIALYCIEHAQQALGAARVDLGEQNGGYRLRALAKSAGNVCPYFGICGSWVRYLETDVLNGWLLRVRL